MSGIEFDKGNRLEIKFPVIVGFAVAFTVTLLLRMRRYIEKMDNTSDKERKIVYSEPENYIPKKCRKKFGLGEYYKDR